MPKSLLHARRLLAGFALLFPVLASSEAHAKPLRSRPPCFTANLSSIEYPDIRVGERRFEEVRLINNCRHTVTIKSITGNPAIFGSNEPTPFAIPSYGYWSVFVYFAPTTPGVHEGKVSVRLRTPGESLIIPVRGKALVPPTISVSQDSLEATVAAGSTAPLLLDVANDGDERIEAIVDLTGPGLPRPAGGWRVLYLNTVIPGQDADDFTRALSARPGVDSVIAFDGTAGTPTLEQLLAYDVVMANGASPWADPNAIGQVLKDYLHAGGKLAILAGGMAFDNPGVLYHPINSYFTFQSLPLASIGGQAASFQTHPINAGVGVFSSTSLIPTSHIGGPGQGSALGHYDNGHLIGAYHPGMPVVCLNVHPVDGGWSGDLPAWVGNAIDYLGGMMNWATYTKPWPNDFIFVVTERSARTLELQVHTYRMAPGTYRGEVKLLHNDPAATNPLVIPINLTLTP